MCFPSRAEGSAHMDSQGCANALVYFFHADTRTHKHTSIQTQMLRHWEGAAFGAWSGP